MRALHHRDTETQRTEETGVSEAVIGYSIEIHKALGPGLLESTYEEFLAYELLNGGHRIKRQIELPIVYKGVRLNAGYRIDLVVDDLVIVELKSVERILPVHEAQLLTYLRLTKKKVGLLINFNVPALKDGVRRFVL